MNPPSVAVSSAEVEVEVATRSQLRGLTVVEIAGSMGGAYCAKLFADGGADVTVLGHGSLNNHQRTYLRRHVKTGASAESIDLAAVDVLIESAAPGPLEPIVVDNAQLVRVQISPLGRTGDRAHWKSTDLTDYAMSGHGILNGVPEREPLAGAPSQPAVAAGLHGFIGALAALLAQAQLGQGQTVQVSHLDVMVALHQTALLQSQCSTRMPARAGRGTPGSGYTNGLYQCRDGWVSIAVATPVQLQGLLAVTDLHVDGRQPADVVLDNSFASWCALRPVVEVVELLQLVRVPAAPVLAPGDLLNDPQLRSRKFFEPIADASDAPMVPGPSVSITSQQVPGNQRWQPGPGANGPLAGLKVLDLSRVWAGPLCARMLRDLGADVVAVEAPNQRGPRSVPQSYVRASGFFPDDDPGEQPWNRNVHLAKFALGKKSIAVDLHTTAGRSVLAQLIGQAHVLIENFSTRVMSQLGFDEDQLHALNPDLIYLTMSAYGRTGPARDWVGYGSTIDAHAGLAYLVGYPDFEPVRGGVAWPDPVAALHATGAVLSCLWHRQSSPVGGATIELSQLESIVAAVGDQVLAYQLDGPRPPMGNRYIDILAQGVYRCRGQDNWIAVSVPDAETLRALQSATGLPGGLGGPSTHFDPDRFDEVLAALAAEHDAHELATRLQAAGVPAAKMASAADVLDDPHLSSRDSWVTIDQPLIGPLVVPAFPITFSNSVLPALGPAPKLGEHNHAVLRAAGFSESELSCLADAAVIATAPPA